MDMPYSPLEFALLNDWQRDFPLTPEPFAEIAAKVSHGDTASPRGTGRSSGRRCHAEGAAPVSDDDVLAVFNHLQRRGAISRVGAVFAPRQVGAGALAAVAAPPGRVENVAALINANAAVNHNYQREHHYNLWFVVTAVDTARRLAALAEIEQQTGCPVIAMPLAEEFHIDLGFDLFSGHSAIKSEARKAIARRALTASELRLGAALQDGLALCARPYRELAERAGLTEAEVLDLLRAWQDDGLIKRLGVVVRHHELGYRANAMVVFDVPDKRASEVGAALAQEAGVTLCYRRERCLPHWPYNLYCMVHGRRREDVAPVVERLAVHAGVTPQILFSVRRFKQCGARYFE